MIRQCCVHVETLQFPRLIIYPAFPHAAYAPQTHQTNNDRWVQDFVIMLSGNVFQHPLHTIAIDGPRMSHVGVARVHRPVRNPSDRSWQKCNLTCCEDNLQQSSTMPWLHLLTSTA